MASARPDLAASCPLAGFRLNIDTTRRSWRLVGHRRSAPSHGTDIQRRLWLVTGGGALVSHYPRIKPGVQAGPLDSLGQQRLAVLMQPIDDGQAEPGGIDPHDRVHPRRAVFTWRPRRSPRRRRVDAAALVQPVEVRLRVPDLSSHAVVSEHLGERSLLLAGGAQGVDAAAELLRRLELVDVARPVGIVLALGAVTRAPGAARSRGARPRAAPARPAADRRCRLWSAFTRPLLLLGEGAEATPRS